MESERNVLSGGSHQFVADDPEQMLRIQESVSQVKPMEDKAFKLFLSNLDIYKEFVDLMLPGEDFSNVYISNGELILSVDNRKVILDSLTHSNMGVLNIEGQGVASDFPFTRHLYYWSYIYAEQLRRGGNWEDLKPVTVVVIYKDGKLLLPREEASLTGTLTLSRSGRNSKNHFRLIAYDASKWSKLKDNDRFKPLLGLLSHGFIKEGEYVEGIDLTDQRLHRFNTALMISCARTRYEQFQKEGDTKMSELLKGFLTDEQEKAAELRGEMKGELRLLISLGKSTQEMADILNMDTSEVERLRKEFKL